jgi:tRNA threonylcarbamoyladenosine biosynthesis protein TsaB
MAYSILTDAGLLKNDLDAVAFGQGPGAFTGVRVACGVAQGMGVALNIPVIPVGARPAVAAKAALEHRASLLFVALDARMDEVYFGAYAQSDSNQIVAVQPPVLLAARDVLRFIADRESVWHDRMLRKMPITLVGEGWGLVRTLQPLPEAWALDDLSARPEAQAVATLALQAWQAGQTVLPEHAAPLYVRDKVAFTTRERAQGDGGNPRAQAPGASAFLTQRPATRQEIEQAAAQLKMPLPFLEEIMERREALEALPAESLDLVVVDAFIGLMAPHALSTAEFIAHVITNFFVDIFDDVE